MTAHTDPIEMQRRDTATAGCRRLRLTLIAGLLPGLALLGGCASVTASGDSAAPDGAFNATYRCDNGQQIAARYLPPNTAEVTVEGRAIDMHIARSASGARYVGGNLVWWTKGSGPGSTGTLSTAEAGTGFAGERITSCVQK